MAANLDSKEDIDNNALKSHIRQWMTLMHDNPGLSVQHTERMYDIFKNKKQLLGSLLSALKRSNDRTPACPVYDIMTYLTIKNQTTK
jgi:replication initiation and membrane attachment protein DnaB